MHWEIPLEANSGEQNQHTVLARMEIVFFNFDGMLTFPVSKMQMTIKARKAHIPAIHK